MYTLIVLSLLVSCFSSQTNGKDVIVQEKLSTEDAPKEQVISTQEANYNIGSNLNVVNRGVVGATFDGQIINGEKLVKEKIEKQAPTLNGLRTGNTANNQFIISAPSGQLVKEQKFLRDDRITHKLNQAPLLYRTSNVINRQGYIVSAPSIEKFLQNQAYQQNQHNYRYAYQAAPWTQTEFKTVRRVFQSPNIAVLNRGMLGYLDFEKFGRYKARSSPPVGRAYTFVKPPFSAPYSFVSGV